MENTPTNPFFETVLTTAVIAVSVAFLYGHTLEVPFYLDDPTALVDNYLLRDLPASFTHIFSQRGLTNLTFALNYRPTGWALPPLHLVNIVLHAGCGFLVWLLLRRLLEGSRWLPLLGALLFVVHPLQTQGVTYVVQRATVMGATLFLLSFLCHLYARTALDGGHSRTSAAFLRPYAVSLVAGACAVLAKEHTLVLPLVIMAYDRLFPRIVHRDWRRAFLDYLPYLLISLVLALLVSSQALFSGTNTQLTTPIASLAGNDSLHYLFTQFSVLWIYLRFLLFPYGQALEHNYPVVSQLLTLQNVLALVGWLVVGWLAWRWRQRYPLAVFGVTWFFLALAVESSVIPLDPLYEHRLYLPMFGLVLLLLDRLPALLRPRLVVAVILLLLMIWAPLTWRRNALWNDPVAFHQDNLKVAPSSERASKALALLYDRSGRKEAAVQLLARTVKEYPRSLFLYAPLATHYDTLGETEKALALLEVGMREEPRYGELYAAAASIFKKRDDVSAAEGYLLRGLRVEGSEKVQLLNSLGVLYSDFGIRPDAEKTFLASLTWPMGERDRATIQLNLAREYFLQERWEEAAAALRTVLQLTPGDPFALEQLGNAALRLSDSATLSWVSEKLIRADPQGWQRLQASLLAARGG